MNEYGSEYSNEENKERYKEENEILENKLFNNESNDAMGGNNKDFNPSYSIEDKFDAHEDFQLKFDDRDDTEANNFGPHLIHDEPEREIFDPRDEDEIEEEVWEPHVEVFWRILERKA